jgi:2-polyprenyl-3-methyl-5-hydroxy-6-metoxy-1,4-benzoquinol methylase
MVSAKGATDLTRFLESDSFKKLSKSKKLVRSVMLNVHEARQVIERVNSTMVNWNVSIVMEHERLPFPSFPYEWPPEMLLAAGHLTLDIAEQLLYDRLGLKDATPYNILFRGSKPVFVDFLSFESRNNSDPIWLPYAQFIRNFLLPLLVNQRLQLPLNEIFITRRDGLEPIEVYRMLSLFQRIVPPCLSLVTIPSWLENCGESHKPHLYQPKRLDNPEQAGFILQRQFKRLRRGLRNVCSPKRNPSFWSRYLDDSLSYTGTQFKAKQAIVERYASEISPKWVLDVGCNTGFFSLMMSKLGAQVVAVDADATVVGDVYRLAENQSLDILPLVADLSRPSPGVGWKNKECPSLLYRLQGKFDLVLMLAVIHHLLISERVPLDEILHLASDLTRKYAIIEFVEFSDPMFQRLCRGREHLFEDLTRERFEVQSSSYFDVMHTQKIENSSRWLYCLKKRFK